MLSREEYLKQRAQKRLERKEKRNKKKYLEAREKEYLRACGQKNELPATQKTRKQYEQSHVIIDTKQTSTSNSIWTVRKK